ncbi:MAG: AAA family ATPase [Nitrospirae bacterium]|nr:AAA family ATPase [Nitrospirota bacterium]
MFRNIRIDNFKVINHIEIGDFKRINLFVGKNNCGKSTVLEALYLLSAPHDAQRLFDINEQRCLTVTDDTVWSLFFHNLDDSSSIELSGELLSLSQIRTLKYSRPETILSGKRISKNTLERIFELRAGRIYEKRVTYIHYEQQEIREEELPQPTMPKKIVHPYKEQLYSRFCSSDNALESIISVFNRIQVKKHTGRLIKVMKKIEPSIESIVNVGSSIYCDAGFNSLIPLNMMGDGIIRLFSIISTICDAHNEIGGGGIVLIDEVEKGLHYSVLDELWDAIYEAATEFDVQVFATTHSMECIRALAEFYRSKSTESDEIRMYRLEQYNGKYDAVDFNSELIIATLDSNWEVR